jgi:hypothetical protein
MQKSRRKKQYDHTWSSCFWITVYSYVQCTLILMTGTLDLEDLRVTPLMERVATSPLKWFLRMAFRGPQIRGQRVRFQRLPNELEN